MTVPTLEGSIVDSFAARLSESEHEALMGGNARRFYKL